MREHDRMECPSCGCSDLGAVLTRHVKKRILRRRDCRHSGRKAAIKGRLPGDW